VGRERQAGFAAERGANLAVDLEVLPA